MGILSIIQEILVTPAILVGMVTLLGLILQKKSLDHVIKGTTIAIVGFVLLSAGSDFLQDGALHDFGILFNYDFQLQGVIPNMEAIASLGIAQYATEISEIMFLGMITNLIIARFSSFRYIFLTGHHTLYMACLLTVVMSASGMSQWKMVVAGSLLLGLLMAMMPALVQKEMEKVTGNKRLALGHFSVTGYLVTVKVAAFVAKKIKKKEQNLLELQRGKSEEIKSTEDIRFPAKLSFMRDSTVGIFLIMTILFLIVTGIAASRTNLSELDIAYQSGGYKNWVIYSVIQGAQFSAAIYVILAGVRLIVAEIVPAFKGIAKKLVPHARPAVDCPILFSYAPNAVMIGFLMSFAGGIVTMLVLIGINAWSGKMLVPVIVPGVVAHFFCGGAAGVFGNSEGGVKGCIAGAFVHGVLISVLALGVMPVLGMLNLSGTTFSDSDFCFAGILVGSIAAKLPENLFFVLCIVIFLLPILWKQIQKGSRKKEESV